MTSIVTKVTKLSHKQFRAILKKFRRKKKRQQLAKEREQLELLEQQRRESHPNYQEWEEEKRRNAELYEQFEERERIRKNKLWLLREEQAQREFKKKQEQLELEKIKNEEERKRIVAEFEQQKILDSQVEEETQKIKSQKEGALKEVLSNLPEDGPWHNPIAPPQHSAGIEREQCQFFAKTGCCRFGERCSRGHIYPTVSNTIMIKGMYTHFSIGQSGRNDFDNDDVLEYEDKERYQDFEQFYWDVLPEFKKFGRVVQFKVCSNHEPHLRGNVYVQYANEEDAVEAYKSFNGRFYAGKQITCEFTNVIKWRSAICGLYFRKRCPKGDNCNFLHVFRNPSDEFRRADRDFCEFESAHSSYSSRSTRARRDTPRSSHYSYSNGSHRRHRDDYSPEHQSYRHISRHHDRATDSEGDDQESVRSSSSKKRYSGKDSYRSHKRKHRDSRSRSPDSSRSSDESSVSYHKKHKHKKKKKSKKSKKERHSDENGDN